MQSNAIAAARRRVDAGDFRCGAERPKIESDRLLVGTDQSKRGGEPVAVALTGQQKGAAGRCKKEVGVFKHECCAVGGVTGAACGLNLTVECDRGGLAAAHGQEQQNRGEIAHASAYSIQRPIHSGWRWLRDFDEVVIFLLPR